MAVLESQLGVVRPNDPRAIGAIRPRFGELAINSFAYYADPVFERTREAIVYGNTPEPGYDFAKDIPQGHEQYASRYAYATNSEHASEITRVINESLQRRQTFDDASIGQLLVAELANPINFLGIPLGGPAIAGGRVAFGVTAARGAGAVALAEGALSVGVQMADPVQSYTETAMNVAMSAMFGAGFASAFSIPVNSRVKAAEATRAQIEQIVAIGERINQIGDISDDAMTRMGPRDSRPLGTDESVPEVAQRLSDEIAALERELASVDSASGESRIIQDRIDELRSQRQPFADEMLYRTLDNEGFNAADMYRPSRGGDNLFLNFVTTPFRRALTGDFGGANNAVKDAFVRLAGDAGTQLHMNEFGIKTPLSVHQASSKDMGEFAVAYEGMVRLWAEDTGAPQPGTSILSGFDLNATSISRTVQKEGNSISAWMSDVARRRARGEEMTEAQRKAAQMMDDYFNRWEARLIETGQIRTRDTISREMDTLRTEIESLRAQVERSGPSEELSRTIAERESALAQRQIEMDDPTLREKSEPFFPRFWNQSAVRRNRAELKNILVNWYNENPYIVRFSNETMSWERVELDTSPDAIARRADETIDTILGEAPTPADPSTIFTGRGRPSAIAARALNIPNSRVFDFIEQNPVNVMSAYASRTAPGYHFARNFGTNFSTLKQRLTLRMQDAGVSEAQIQKTMRDFTHLYDRVVGRVIRDPDAWDQKTAAVLRDMASMTYLGRAGIAAFADFGRIVMEHNGETLGRTAQAMFDPALRSASRSETRALGGALEMLLGSAHMRMVDDQNWNPINNGAMDRVRNAFHTLNLLGPVTVMAKQFSGAAGAHLMIEASQRLARGTASDFDVRYLARYGIDAELAARIASAPFQVDPKTGFILPNTDAWVNGYRIPEVEGGRVRVVEANEDGSAVGKTNANGEYVPAFYRPNKAQSSSVIVTWDNIQLGQAVTLYRGEGGVNGSVQGGNWWTTDLAKAKQYGAVKSLTVQSDEIASIAVRGHGGPDEFLFPNGLPQELSFKIEDFKLPSDGGTIYFDREYIEGPMFERKAWTQPRMEGVDPLPENAFSNPREWSNFVMWHEIMHTRFSAEDLGLPPRSAAYENRINQMAMEQHRNSQTVAQDTVDRFRAAVNTHVNNMVLMSTAADKPIMMDGVVYVPENMGRMFGLAPDPRNPGYSRVENAFIGLPLQFFSYSLANVNKTVGLMMQGAVRSRVTGMAAMMGLGYMVTWMRTPDNVWDRMSPQDKLARSFDMSGIAALYSDLFYTGLQTSLALGGPNPTGGFIAPRFPQQPNALDAVTGLTGAASSWTLDMGRSAYSFANGEYGEGAAQFVRNLPFSNLWFMRSEINELSRYLSRF